MNRAISMLVLLYVTASAAVHADGAAMPADCPLHSSHAPTADAAAKPADPAPAASAAPLPSSYVGLEDREVAALSTEEIEILRAGSGHGMALPAELHHYPGPRHVFDLAAELQLGPVQREAMAAIYDRMHRQAIALGERILAGESELDRLFRDGQPTAAAVERLSVDLGRWRGELRAAHLVAHLAAREQLSADQVARYDRARGYTGAEHSHHNGNGRP